MKRVLVVDDSEFMGRLVECFLNKRGWHVEVCDKPFGVLNKVKEFGPHIILMDIKMPGLSGNNLAGLLRDYKDNNNVKMLSFSSELEVLQKKMVEDGIFDGYFVKGASFGGLCEEMKRLLDDVH